jgi:hypothetical protein
MKILPISVALLVCLTIDSSAQLSFGVKAAISVNDIHGQNQVFKSAGNTVGWNAGVYSNINLSTKFSLIPEVQIVRRKYDIYGFSETVQVSNVQLNALVSYAPVKMLAIELGPYVSERVGINSRFSDKEFAAHAFNKKTEIGLVAGMRFNITNSLALTTRYGIGLTPVANSDLRDDQYRPMGLFTQYWRGAELAVVYQIIKRG